MRVDAELISRLEPHAEVACAHRSFSYVDVIDFSRKPAIADLSDVLWCVTKSANREDWSWYGERFDRSAKLTEIASRRGWVALTDDRAVAAASPNGHIWVPDLSAFLHRLNRFVLDTIKPEVVGVTGSVGKTTCVALMEDVFAQYGRTLRVYAKRITPLSLFELLINQLDYGTRYVVMEYSMFYRWHVGALVALLPPTVGVLLNINRDHVGIDGIQNKQDIFEAKRPLLDQARFAFVEKNVPAEFSSSVRSATVFDAADYVKIGGHVVNPFVRSRLQYVQIGAAFVAKEALVGPVTSDDIAVAERFRPKENRLMRVADAARVTFFDGEITSGARLKSMGESFYDAKVLVLHDAQFFSVGEVWTIQGLELEEGETLQAALACFDTVYLSRDLNPGYMSFVERCADAAGVAVVKYETHVPTMRDDAAVFIHWGAYWREHQDDVEMRRTFQSLF